MRTTLHYTAAVVLLYCCGFAAADVPQSLSCDAGDVLQPSCDAVAGTLTDAVAQRLSPAVSAAFTTTTATGDALPSTRGTPLLPVTFVAHTGQFTYDSNAAVIDNSTTYDMASCSKIIGATTSVAQLYQQGLLKLEAPVTDYLGPAFAANGKGSITVLNLLLHNSGFPPDPTPYNFNDPLFGCPQSQHYHPGQDFSCESRIYNAVLQQSLINPVGAKYVYSDISMMTVMFIVAEVVRQHNLIPIAELPPLCAYQYNTSRICLYYAYVKRFVIDRLGMTSTDYVPSSSLRTPPEWQDDYYRHGLIMGYVSDENAYAMGGVSGHAGAFSTVSDVLRWARAWAGASPTDPYLNRATVARFSAQYNAAQSSRALGWDTNNQTDPPCGALSPRTFLHLGYTGTQFCIDPDNGIVTVLLTNARYPVKSKDGAIVLRPKFNSAVLSSLLNPPAYGGGASTTADVLWGMFVVGLVGLAVVGVCLVVRRRTDGARRTTTQHDGSDLGDVPLSSPGRRSGSAGLYQVS